jgi:hypothetical protein
MMFGSVEITGVEDDPGGGLRVYITGRYNGIYFVPFPEDEQKIERGWAASYCGHLLIDPDEAWGALCHATLPGHEPGYHHRDRRR